MTERDGWKGEGDNTNERIEGREAAKNILSTTGHKNSHALERSQIEVRRNVPSELNEIKTTVTEWTRERNVKFIEIIM